MKTLEKDVVIVGGGPAGLAVAIQLYKNGIKNIIIIEREKTLGGILRQCIHDGFGVERFGTTLSGPEYAQRFIDEVHNFNIPYITNSTVVEVENNENIKSVIVANRDGMTIYKSSAIVFATGCRERTRGALGIPGERPSGVFTAGVAQSYINIHNIQIAKNVIILGSGDIGLIMARRLTFEGVNVKGVFEIQPYPSGLPRNIQQCLNDYNIPLYLSHTVTEIHGKSRLTGVTISQVDEQFNIIPNTEKTYDCDTLILSVGLIPENELCTSLGINLDERTKGVSVDENYQSNKEGIFVTGNALQVHDLVDFVSAESERVSNSVTNYLNNKLSDCNLTIYTDKNISYTMPERISGNVDVTISLRVKKPMNNCTLAVKQMGEIIYSKKIIKALPAEMIQFILKENTINLAKNLEVSIQC